MPCAHRVYKSATAPATTPQVQLERAAIDMAPELAVVEADADDDVAAAVDDCGATTRDALEVVATAGVVDVLAGAIELPYIWMTDEYVQPIAMR